MAPRGDVFSLVGPKRYDVPWKELESKGWIAEAICTEIRLELPEHLRIPYAVATKREKFRIASENPSKEDIVVQLVANHREDSILVIGQYIEQLEKLAKILGAPLITGSTPNAQREVLYEDFRSGENSGHSWCRKSPTLPSTSPTLRWRSKFLEPSDPGRRRPRGWAGS